MKSRKIVPCLFVAKSIHRRPNCKGKGAYSYRSLGTLADPKVPRLTCSDYVARRYVAKHRVVPFASFEEAATAVENGAIDTFLVPAAYRDVAKFIQSNHYRLLRVFVVPIPALVFAGLTAEIPNKSATLYYQPATESLLSEIPMPVENYLPVASNAVACRAVLDSGGTATTVTNQLCADYFGLTTYKVLRPGQKMPFFQFAANK